MVYNNHFLLHSVTETTVCIISNDSFYCLHYYLRYDWHERWTFRFFGKKKTLTQSKKSSLIGKAAFKNEPFTKKISLDTSTELRQVKQKQRTSKNNTRTTPIDVNSETCEKQFNFIWIFYILVIKIMSHFLLLHKEHCLINIVKPFDFY